MLPFFTNNFMHDIAELIDSCYQHSVNNQENEEEAESCETPGSYYHFVSDKFEDGKNVSHKEKIVRDGKVVKDVEECHFIGDKTDTENNPEYKKEEKKEETATVEQLQKKVKSLGDHITKIECEKYDMYDKNCKLAEQNDKLKNEVELLRKKLDAIKKMF